MAKQEVVVDSVEASALELKRQRKAAKKAAREATPAAVVEEAQGAAEDTLAAAPKKRKLKKRKAAAVEEAAAAVEEAAPAAEEEEVDGAEAKRQRKAAKKAAKRAAEAPAEEAEVEEPPQKKKKKGMATEAEPKETKDAPTEVDATVDFTAFVRGLPFSIDEDTLRRDFTECGPIEKINLPMNDEGRPRGIGFIKFETQEGFDAALKFDNTEYGGRTIFVVKAGEGGKGKGKDAGKGKAKGEKGDYDNEFTVCVRGLPFTAEEEALRKDFSECGEIVTLKLPMNDEGRPRGIAFIKYSSQEGFDAALKFDSTEYGGRTIYASKAGEGGKGKGKDGKGKDGKGKGKGKKGKK